MPRHILVLDNAAHPMAELRDALSTTTGSESAIGVVTDGAQLGERLRHEPAVDLVLLPFPGGDGRVPAAELLRQVRTLDGEVPVVAVADRGDVHSAASAVAAGATDFLVLGDRLPDRLATLLGKVRRVLAVVERNRRLRAQNQRLRQVDVDRSQLVGQSPQIREVLETVERVAAIPRPVLIVGERGTGKELVARAIHAASGRGDEAFVAVNCAAFPETLLESELFGHERGAFTGADRMVPGKFEQADRGTLFLDEIAHMPMTFQQKILRVVEYGTFTRIGATRELRTTARVLAATNVDLQEAMREGRFLPDLYDRLAFETVRVPPLRERLGDVVTLAEHFLRQFLREVPALGAKRFAPEALARLERYGFPGNVRELKTLIERAAYRDTTSEITTDDLGLQESAAPAAGSFHERVAAYQRRLIDDALAAAGGNRAEAARRLGLAYHRFRYYAQKLEVGRS